MTWPPVKAWTSKLNIDGIVHFVAINYGGELQNKWVILMSVLDSSLVLKVPWSQLVDSSKWESGWNEIHNIDPAEFVNNKADFKTTDFVHPSNDSGLTIPISKNTIRPWFYMD